MPALRLLKGRRQPLPAKGMETIGARGRWHGWRAGSARALAAAMSIAPAVAQVTGPNLVISDPSPVYPAAIVDTAGTNADASSDLQLITKGGRGQQLSGTTKGWQFSARGDSFGSGQGDYLFVHYYAGCAGCWSETAGRNP